ncbi:hypothetical protein J1N35_003245 [Gossypium stocksii]|uniref:Uncharacterized protein n=1 Tax=Gossypium stocksii TaxID=47602 RepID=A0A9D4ANK9_9ROSI|nr:hypothetical protein J1N35_003245 [Gossypium stocksii]
MVEQSRPDREKKGEHPLGKRDTASHWTEGRLELLCRKKWQWEMKGPQKRWEMNRGKGRKVKGMAGQKATAGD